MPFKKKSPFPPLSHLLPLQVVATIYLPLQNPWKILAALPKRPSLSWFLGLSFLPSSLFPIAGFSKGRARVLLCQQGEQGPTFNRNSIMNKSSSLGSYTFQAEGRQKRTGKKQDTRLTPADGKLELQQRLIDWELHPWILIVLGRT